MQVQSLGQEDPLDPLDQPTSVPLPGKFHEQRSMVDCSPRDWKELNMTKHIHYLLHLVNSNPYF